MVKHTKTIRRQFTKFAKFATNIHNYMGQGIQEWTK